MVRLFYLAINSSERDSLLDVLSQVVNLEKKDREELSVILKSAQLANIIATMSMINDRFKAVDELKQLAWNKSFEANERDHLQTHIEQHYWLFGEQYHLVTAAEPKFEEALRRYVYILQGENKPRTIDHPDKLKEMDIFAVRIMPLMDEIHNIVVELKHPDIVLGEDELSQVKRYMRVILDQPEFNASNMRWNFYLVGNEYDDYIAGEINNARTHGEKHLAFSQSDQRYKIYVMRWSEVITNFELRHKFLLEKLKLERQKLSTDKTSADEILASRPNSAAYVTEEELSPV